MKKIISVIASIIVIVILLVFIFSPKNKFSYNENRYLTSFPKININTITSGKFMTELNDYISDHFPFRENLLGLKSIFYKNLGVYKQEDIYYGKDNKLYQEYPKPESNDVIIKRVNSLKDKINSNVYFMLVPTSIYIYDDQISKYNTNYDEGKTIDYYKNNLDVTFIDIRNSLNNNKDEYLYYGTDHHWTTRGANIAYLDYCEKVGIKPNNYSFEVVNKKFYGTLYSKVLDNSLDYDVIEKVKDNNNYSVYYYDTNKTTNSLYNEEYLNKKDKYSYFLDNNHSLIKIENNNSNNNETLLIIKDSYANTFVPLIVNNYKYVYVIDPRYYDESISDFINSNKINNILFLYNVLTLDDDLGIVSIN